MVQLNFELPSVMAATLQNRAGNDQNCVDDIIQSALLGYFEQATTNEELLSKLDFKLPPNLLAKAKQIASKANVDVDAIVQVALQQYFSQTRTAVETLPAILGRLTGIPVPTTNA